MDAPYIYDISRLRVNDALYCVTHPSYTSNVGPTTVISSRYVDVVTVRQWVDFVETDGRLIVLIFSSQQELVSLINSCKRNGLVSVHNNVMQQQIVKVLLCSLGYTRPGHKIPGLSSEGAVQRHCGAQGQTVNLLFHLEVMRLQQDAFRRNGQEMAVCCVADDNGPVQLAELMQPMLAERNVPQVRKPQNTPRTALFYFFLLPAL